VLKSNEIVAKQNHILNNGTAVLQFSSYPCQLDDANCYEVKYCHTIVTKTDSLKIIKS